MLFDLLAAKLFLQSPITHTMKHSLVPFTLIGALTFQNASATTVVADFNDNTQAPLGDVDLGVGQNGGLGFLAGDTWSNTGTIDVVADDLTAPAFTNYAIAQEGPPQSIQGSFFKQRQSTRALSSPLTGTAWFSFLLNQPSLASRGGITFNQNISGTVNPRILVLGTEVLLGLGTTFQAAGAGVNLPAIGETALILGRVTIDAAGDETIDIWVNPDVSGDETSLPTPDNTLSGETPSLENGINRVGLISYASETGNESGIIDALRLSDALNAYEVVAQGTAGIEEDPNLSTLFTNPFAGSILSNTDDPLIADLSLTNSGDANDLIIADTTGITGADAASYTILTSLPLTIAPGTSETLQIQLDPSGEARASSASLNLSSNDVSTPDITIPLEAQITSTTGNQLLNSDFEADPATATNWELQGEVTIAEGIAPGSTNSVSLAADSNISQEILAGEANWTLSAYFQAPDTAERGLNILVDAVGTPANRTSNINLRFQGTSAGAAQTWNLFDQATVNNAWGDAIDLPAVQPGATYFIRITGRNWGGETPNPTYDIELSEPNSTSIAGIVTDLGRFQTTIPSTPPNQIRFSSLFGNSPGYILDDVQFENTLPPSNVPVITSVAYDTSTQSNTLEFEALIGTTYTISASNDLLNWDDIEIRTATSTLESVTEVELIAPKRFYQISINP